MTIRSIARRLIGEQLLGHLDYYRYPERRQAWGGPFNSQKSRTTLFRALMESLSPVAIVETGTYLGTTTEFLADTGRSVYSIEGHPRAYGFAKARLRRRRNVTLLRGDSRELLRKLSDGPLRSLAGRTLFFYLDAHWNVDLPLAEELEIVFARYPAAVVMIDDFQVSDDPAYAYDDYGPNKALTTEYVAPAMVAHDLVAFYPTARGSEESGARRGCVVLAQGAIHGTALAALPLLRPAGLALTCRAIEGEPHALPTP
jgi:predicted O-methyltransferase YrrM